MHGLNLFDFHARQQCPATGRFLSIDPLAEARPWESPYAFTGNNPINRIDPTGLIHYSINSRGHIEPMRDTDGNILGKDDKFDMLFAGDKSLRVNDQSILSGLATKRDRAEYDGSYAETNRQADVFNVFAFVANNTEVEWSLSGFSTKGGTYVITTNHKEGSVRPAHSMKKYDVFDLIFDIHNHPGGAEQRQASAAPQHPSDIGSLTSMAWQYHNKFEGKHYRLPPHYIYHPQSSSVLQYTVHPEINRGIVRGTSVKTGVGIRRAMGLIK